MFRRSLHSLLMYQIDIAQGRLLMGIKLEQLCLDEKLVSGSNGIIARISDIAGSIFFKFVFAELK